MDRAFCSADAFDLSPLAEVEIGPRTYPVLPLTYGRWRKLRALRLDQLLLAMARASLCVGRKDLDSDEARDVAREFGEAVRCVLPTLTAEAWKEHGSLSVVMDLYRILGESHDWNAIIEADGMFSPRAASDGPARTDEEGFLAFCSVYPTQGVPELYALRVEGFYRTMAAAVERAREEGDRPAPGDPEMTPATDAELPWVRGPEAEAEAARISALMDAARDAEAARE